MLYRALLGVVAPCLVAVAAVSIGCSSESASQPPTAPSVPTPMTPPPPSFSVRSVAPSSGPTIGGDYIRIVGEAFQSGATVSIDGVTVQVTKITSTTIDARTLAHAGGPVDVVVMNGDGQVDTLKAAYTFAEFSVTGGPDFVAPGGELTVSWIAPSGRGCNGGGDWIAIYRVGAPDQTGAANGHSDLWFDHVCGATSGTWKLKAPAAAGEYEFRFMVGDFSVARSHTITVSE